MRGIGLAILSVLAAVSLAEKKQFMCHNKIDMVILMDGSGSVTMDQFKVGKKFVADLIKHFDISKEKTNVAMASYSQYTHTGRTFNDKTSRESVLKAVDELPYEGAASRLDFGFDLIEFKLFDAKNGARTSSKDVKKVAVFLSDGFSTRGVEFTKASADTLTRRGIKLFSVGISGHIDEAELDELSSKPRESHRLNIETPGKFFTKDQVEHFAKEICRDE